MRYLISLILFFALTALTGCKPDDCENGQVMAAIMSEKFIARLLKAPATAQFPSANDAHVTKLERCKYQVVSYVDSQNGFGALIRTPYTVTMNYHEERNTWSGSDAEISK